MISEELLHHGIETGMIDLSAIQSDLDMKKREEALQKHKFKIWQNNTSGRWLTHLPDMEKGRKLVSKKTLEELEDTIAKYYMDTVMKPCFPEVFEEWIAEKEQYREISESSLCRYRIDYRRFFPVESEFCKIRLCDMDESILERFIKQTIRECQLTAKSYSGLRTLLNGVFKYAKREKYTDFSIATFFMDLSLPKNIFSHNAKQCKSEVFSDSELRLLEMQLRQRKIKKDLAVLLQIYTGLRVGELTALKPSDNARERVLHVCRTEYGCIDKETGKRVIRVKDFPKTENSVRDIILPKKAQHILNLLKMQVGADEFLLSENGKRITSKQINYHLQKVCREIGIPPRSTHKIRKSYASTLLSKSVDEAFVQNQMGHKQITTTHKYYHYDILSDESKFNEIDRVMSG